MVVGGTRYCELLAYIYMIVFRVRSHCWWEALWYNALRVHLNVHAATLQTSVICSLTYCTVPVTLWQFEQAATLSATDRYEYGRSKTVCHIAPTKLL